VAATTYQPCVELGEGLLPNLPKFPTVASAVAGALSLASQNQPQQSLPATASHAAAPSHAATLDQSVSVTPR